MAPPTAPMMEAELIGSSAGIERVRQRIEPLARASFSVLICGETGTGKEVVARQLHRLSGRTGDFVAVDCASLVQGVLESELFGHEKGAFTGADRKRIGLVESAANGTLFLDEIGELAPEAQSRLLRLLENGSFRPVGGNTDRASSARVIAATWRDLNDLVATGGFRKDLYHRLRVAEIELPPLRHRAEDIGPLFCALIREICEGTGRTPPRVEDATFQVLQMHDWPGNIRELRNVVQYAIALGRKPTILTPEDLPPSVRRQPAPRIGPVRIDLPYQEAREQWLRSFQEHYITQLLEAHGGNVSAAARAAGMDRRTLQRIVAHWGAAHSPSSKSGYGGS